MSLLLSSAAITEKNKLSTSGVWIVLLEINTDAVASPIRVTSNNENTVWNSHTYVPFPFEFDEISEGTVGETSSVNLKIANASRAIELYLQEYDTYVKTNGPAPITLTLSVVNSLNLYLTTAEVEYEFTLKKPSSGPLWATFALSGDNLFNIRFPLNRMYKNRCRYREFKGDRCGYTGVETTCDRSLSRCRELSNSERYGGFPGMGRSPLYVT
jgi:phage-related protein